MIFDLVNALLGSYGGRRCRRCNEPIHRRDGFGMSEGVCSACSA